LHREGFAINHKRVLRLMREDNLLCLRKRAFVPVTTDSRHGWPQTGLMQRYAWGVYRTAAGVICRAMSTPHEPSPTREPSVQKAFLAALAAAALSVALASCGTTPYDIAMSDRQHAEDEQACKDSGFKPGTNQFEKCMQDRHLTRMHLTPSDSVSPR
jgi:hypothetical protein